MRDTSARLVVHARDWLYRRETGHTTHKQRLTTITPRRRHATSCNDVLRVLRDNKDTLLTILDVMTNDPLYKFLVSPVQKKKAQKDEGADEDDGDETEAADESSMDAHNTLGQTLPDSEGAWADDDDNEAARRALAKIGSKLRGYEENTPESLSVEGQVQLLITEARSMENLSRLYFGWSPWT